MTLCMDKKIIENFEALDPQAKAAFTREYNKQHKDDFTGKKAAGKKGAAKAKTVSGDNDEDENLAEDEGTQMLDEEQLADIRKGKKLEK